MCNCLTLPKLTSSTVRWSCSRRWCFSTCSHSRVSNIVFLSNSDGSCGFLTSVPFGILYLFDFSHVWLQMHIFTMEKLWKTGQTQCVRMCHQGFPYKSINVTNWATHPTVALMSFITSSTSVRNSLGVSLRCSQLCQNISTGTKTLTDNRLVFRSKQSEKWPPNTD